MGACDQCYRAKLRCNGSRLVCDRCIERRCLCTYTTNRPLGRPKLGRRALSDVVHKSMVIGNSCIESDLVHIRNGHAPNVPTDGYNVVENAEAPASWCGPPRGLVLQDNTRQAEDAAQAASMTGANGCEPTGDPSLPLFLLNSTYDAVDDVEITGIFDERAMLVNTPHMDLNMVLSHDSPDSTKYSFSPRLQDHGTSKSTNQRYAQAVQLISTLANEHHCDPPQQFDSVLLQAEQSIDFVANVAAWVAQNRDTSQTIAVLVTLGHLVIHLALKKYRQLRTEISYNPETDESMHGTNIGSSPCRIAVGNFEIRNLDTRQQVLEALIKAETVRAKEAATVLRQQFQRIMVRANQIGLSVDTMWTCLVEHDQ